MFITLHINSDSSKWRLLSSTSNSSYLASSETSDGESTFKRPRDPPPVPRKLQSSPLLQSHRKDLVASSSDTEVSYSSFIANESLCRQI